MLFREDFFNVLRFDGKYYYIITCPYFKNALLYFNSVYYLHKTKAENIFQLNLIKRFYHICA